MTDDMDMADVTWGPATFHARHAMIYDDRKLTWREWIAVRWFHRRDPRVLAFVDYEESE